MQHWDKDGHTIAFDNSAKVFIKLQNSLEKLELATYGATSSFRFFSAIGKNTPIRNPISYRFLDSRCIGLGEVYRYLSIKFSHCKVKKTFKTSPPAKQRNCFKRKTTKSIKNPVRFKGWKNKR